MAERKYTCEVHGCNEEASRRRLCVAHYKRLLRHGSPVAGANRRAKRGAPVAFIAEAAASQTDDCIIWPFATDKDGYGKLGRSGRAHREVLKITKGPAPSEKHEAAHLPLACHNPSCVNPRHLRWATVSENSQDRFLDGTDCCGERGGNTKLSEVEIGEIRLARAAGETLTSIASRYGTTPPNVRNIAIGKTWVGRRGSDRTVSSA